MLTNILKLANGKVLDKKEQQTITGGGKGDEKGCHCPPGEWCRPNDSGLPEYDICGIWR